MCGGEDVFMPLHCHSSLQALLLRVAPDFGNHMCDSHSEPVMETVDWLLEAALFITLVMAGMGRTLPIMCEIRFFHCCITTSLDAVNQLYSGPFWINKKGNMNSFHPYKQ